MLDKLEPYLDWICENWDFYESLEPQTREVIEVFGEMKL